MARLELNALINALHGTVGDLVLVRDGDNVYVQRQVKEFEEASSSGGSPNTYKCDQR